MTIFAVVVITAFFAYITGYGIGWSDGFKQRDKIAEEFRNDR